jgi:hypothetical protein
MSRRGLEEVRKHYFDRASRAAKPEVNDQLRFAPVQPGSRWEVAFRFLSAYRVPDAILFQRTMQRPLAGQDLPIGLEVCAALGSAFARDQLARQQPKVMEEIDRSRPLFESASLYAEYLGCLGVLLGRIEPDAPAFFRTDAWRIKTCQAALSGWAQMRHTWALQAKQGALYICVSSSAAGLVEPVPEFYGELTELVERTRDALASAGLLTPGTGKEILQELAADLPAAQALVRKARKDKKGLRSFSPDERDLLAQFDPELNELWERPERETDSEKTLSDLAFLLESYASLVERGRPEIFAGLAGFDASDLGDNWNRLARVCRRLELLAHKQLRQVPFNEKENGFLTQYGKELAHIMLYGGNSYFSSRDDAPRIVEVFSDPARSKRLLVCTARPRTLWVLYPVKGKDMLCRGAVLPYHEFSHTERLTDAAWKAMLDSPQHPRTPAWIRSGLIEESSPKPKSMK